MKGLVLAFALGLVLMLLLGCAQGNNPPAANGKLPNGEKEGAPALNGNGAMEKDSNNPIPNISIKTATIDKVCLPKVVEAYCSNHNDTLFQIPEADGIPRGRGYEQVYLKNIYEPGNSEHPNPINCTLQFKVTPHNGGEPRYSQVYRATLRPGEVAGPYRMDYLYNEEESENIRTGTTWITECKDYPQKG